ncbi:MULTISPECIES: hypothetical protein [Nostoc]|uniref:Uncharacterized protein n=2 Tax=Nostoc TaxID=1177 RepID=A0ABR8IJZ1_9NOSO|nr:MULTISPECIES: hypothetical protein [Nostoc]MBD2564835.1 hypothetical protein [Nostoc linckia FACHB-391]MBD2651464.1 hypothetical protein [Nostoc foliaceum FACHB-393]
MTKLQKDNRIECLTLIVSSVVSVIALILSLHTFTRQNEFNKHQLFITSLYHSIQPIASGKEDQVLMAIYTLVNSIEPNEDRFRKMFSTVFPVESDRNRSYVLKIEDFCTRNSYKECLIALKDEAKKYEGISNKKLNESNKKKIADAKKNASIPNANIDALSAEPPNLTEQEENPGLSTAVAVQSITTEASKQEGWIYIGMTKKNNPSILDTTDLLVTVRPEKSEIDEKQTNIPQKGDILIATTNIFLRDAAPLPGSLPGSGYGQIIGIVKKDQKLAVLDEFDRDTGTNRKSVWAKIKLV